MTKDTTDVRDELVTMVRAAAPSAQVFTHAPSRTSEESLAARQAASGERVTGAKALLVKIDVAGAAAAFAVIVLPGFNKLDSKILKQELKARVPGARNFRFATAEEMTAVARGLSPGKMPPFGRPLFPLVTQVFIDQALLDHARIGFNAADFAQSIIMDTSEYVRLVQHDGIFPCSAEGQA